MKRKYMKMVVEGQTFKLMEDPEHSQTCATVVSDDRVIWCHPKLWEMLDSIRVCLTKPPEEVAAA